MLRATQARQLGLRNKPTRFLAWAARNEIAVPARLAEAVRRHDPEQNDWKGLYHGALAERDGALRRVAQLESDTQVKGLRTRERETLLKLLVGMAVATYKHDPTATRTSTAAAISQDLHSLGISIDEDTVRKWLKEAADFLPPQTEHD